MCDCHPAYHELGVHAPEHTPESDDKDAHEWNLVTIRDDLGDPRR